MHEQNPAFGWNPISRRYIKRNGAVYKRLVMSGVVVDEAVSTILENPLTGTPRRAPNRVAAVAQEPTPVDRVAAAESKRSASRIRAQLDDLPPDELELVMRGVMAMRATQSPAGPRSARWKATPAALTDTDTDYAPADAGDSDSDDDAETREPPAAAPPIRIPRRTATSTAAPSRIRRR